MNDNLSMIRDKLIDLKTRRIELLAQRNSRKAVRALFERQLADMERVGLRQIDLAVDRLAAGRAANPFLCRGNTLADAQGSATLIIDIGPMLVALLGPETILDAISARVERIPLGLEHGDRQKIIGGIEQQIDDLERKEEALISEMERSGVEVLRRPDARPEIVLA